MRPLDIIALGYRPWSHAEENGINVRDLHLVTRLAEQDDIGRILYVSRPVSRAERWIRRTPYRLASPTILEGEDFTLCAPPRHPKIAALNIKSSALIAPLLRGRAWWAQALMAAGAQRAIQASLAALNMSRDVALNWVPFAADAVPVLGCRVEAFDVIDNFANHQRITATSEIAACQNGYASIARRADVITSVSAEAAAVFHAHGRTNVEIIPNGVDRALTSATFEKPASLAGLRGPIVGTGGNFFSKFRVDFLVDLARQMPEVNFVMLGNILEEEISRQIAPVPNIHYLGNHTFEDALAHYYHFDAGFIFYDMKRENDGDPLKLYEFLAVGTPVVSLASMGIRQRDNVVEVVETPADCAARLRQLLQRDRAQCRALARATLRPEDFWDVKAGRLAAALRQAYDRAGGGPVIST